jgi:hypothetical protein
MKSLLTGVLLLAIFGNAYAWNPFKKQTYEECILENMKGVKSDDAASQIQMACVIKTSKNSSSNNSNKCIKRKLTLEERKLVSATAKVESYGWLVVKIYNGNKNVSIMTVKAKIVDLDTKKEFEFNLTNSNVSPMRTSGEMLAELLYAPKKWDWDITEITTEECK